MKTSLISILFLVLSLPVMADTPTFFCVGTEPFWSMNVSESEGWIRFRRPEGNMSLRIISRRTANGSARYGAFITSSRYTSLTVARGECSDGMSDNIYTHTAVFDMGGNNIYYGCCDIDGAELW